MAEKRSRQLAAIMFADMVGYTALMQEDEERAREQRDRHREVLSSAVPEHNGKILQYYGDGTLSVFQSAVQAVECALEIQLRLREDPKVPLRIGVHTGDIVHDQDGVYGDGVNVAARIEALAAPGGILISGKVFDEIKNHPSLSVAFIGDVRLKNVKNPLPIFAITNEGLGVPAPEEVKARTGGKGGGPCPDREGDLVVGTLPTAPELMGPGEAFIQALRARYVIPWALTYVAAAWVLLQIVAFAARELGWPTAVSSGAGVLAFVGFFVALVVTWYHGERGPQRVKGSEVLLIAFLLMIAGGALTRVTSRQEVPTAGPLSSVPSHDPRPAVAVLPFDNFSPSPEDAYFADGVWEDVTSALSRIHGLRVPGRSSAEQFREDRPSIQEMAAALGADYVLEGSARVAGGSVNVTVQLIDGRTDEHLWAGDYDRDFTIAEVIAVQSEIATEVASHLSAIITPEEAEGIAALPTTVPEAFILYRRARYRWNERTQPAVAEAVNLYREAIALDSTFAAPHAGLADAFLVLANWGWMDHHAAYTHGISSARRALELDPGIAGAHASLGGLYLWSHIDMDWALSEESFLTAIDLDADHAYARYWYSVLLSAQGRHGESIAQAEAAAALDPLSPPIAYGLARSLFMARDYARSIEEARLALELHPDYGNLHSQLCISLIAAGDFGEAEAACLRHRVASGVQASLNVAILRAYQGDREAALTETRAALDAGDEDSLQPVIVAMVHAGLGDSDEAIRWIERAVEGGYPHLEYLSTHPFFDPLRSDPRFESLVRGLDLYVG